MDRGTKEAVGLAYMLLDEYETMITDLAVMIYDLSEGSAEEEESLEESFRGTSQVIEIKDEESKEDLFKMQMTRDTPSEEKLMEESSDRSSVESDIID